MKIIVNADDYGANENVNRAISECFRNHWISQTTLLVNKPMTESAVEHAKAEGFADRIGLHLNFTDGKPLTEGIRMFSEFCDENGMFKKHRNGNPLLPFSRDVAEAVRQETIAQIERYLALGLPLMHCDGHHHVHNRMQFSYVVLPLLKRYGFKSVRNRYSIFTRPWVRSFRGRIRIGLFEFLSCRNELSTTSGFGDWDGETLERWKSFDTVEIMVHPNFDAIGRNVNVTDFAACSGPEMELLSDLIQAVGAEMIPYSTL